MVRAIIRVMSSRRAGSSYGKRSGVQAFVADEGVDGGLGVGPVGGWLFGGEGFLQTLGHRRVLDRLRGGDRAGGDEGRGGDAFGVVDGDGLRDTAAHRQADEVGAVDAERVQDADRVGLQISRRVLRFAGLVAHRAAGVAMVVPDDEASRGRQVFAERGLPEVHRGRATVDQQDRRVGLRAEGLDTEFDTVGL